MAQPDAHAAVVSIDILDVDGAAHVFPGAHIDTLMGDTAARCKRAVGGMRVSDEQGVRRQDGRQVGDEPGRRDEAAAGDGIDGSAAAVTRHEYAHQIT